MKKVHIVFESFTGAYDAPHCFHICVCVCLDEAPTCAESFAEGLLLYKGRDDGRSGVLFQGSRVRRRTAGASHGRGDYVPDVSMDTGPAPI